MARIRWSYLVGGESGSGSVNSAAHTSDAMINSRLQHPECQKYKLWKKAQQVKTNAISKKVKKKNKKGPFDDCLEDENNEGKEKAAPLQIDYEKCKERQKKQRRRARAALARAIPILKQLEDRIQPPISVRDQWINQRHYPCLIERRPSIEHALLRKISTNARAKKKVRKSKKSQDAEPSDSEKKDEVQDEAKDEAKDEDEQKDTTSKGSPSQQRVTSDTEGVGTAGTGSEGDKKIKQKKKKKKTSKKRVVYPYEPPYSGESECESVCSFDSEICLAGLTLTPEEKKELENHQKRKD